MLQGRCSSWQCWGEGGGCSDAGNVLGWLVHVDPSSRDGGGKWEQEAVEGYRSLGLEQTASSPQALPLCQGLYSALFHSQPCEIRFSSRKGMVVLKMFAVACGQVFNG